MRPSHVPAVSFPFRFHAQTAVVICGVYPTVQRSLGRIFVLVISLLDVPVFAATGRHLSVRYVFQVDGRAVVSERIVEIR